MTKINPTAQVIAASGKLLDTLEAMGVLTTPWVCRIPPSGALATRLPSSISSYDMGLGAASGATASPCGLNGRAA